MLYVAPIV